MLKIFKRIEKLEKTQKELTHENYVLRGKVNELEAKVIYGSMSKQELYDNFKYCQFDQINAGAVIAIKEKFDIHFTDPRCSFTFPTKATCYRNSVIGRVIDEYNLLKGDSVES